MKDKSHQPGDSPKKGLAGIVSRLFRKKPPAAHESGGVHPAHHDQTWTAQQFRTLVTLGDSSDFDAAGSIGHPVEAVRRMRGHVHLYHRDGVTAGLSPMMLRILRDEREPATCAVCRTGF